MAMRTLLLTLTLLPLPVQAAPKLKVTAYCLGKPRCKRCGTRGLTALGSRGGRGIAVGARRKAYALKTLLSVPGYGRARVDDTGGGVGPGQIDLRFPTHREAERWGVKWLRVRQVR